MSIKSTWSETNVPDINRPLAIIGSVIDEFPPEVEEAFDKFVDAVEKAYRENTVIHTKEL